jgi:E3 ubiquitin-protein ligase NRDP1
LRSLCHSQQQKLAELKTEITDQNLTINELKRELNLIKDFMRAMRVSNPAMRAIADQMERDEVLRWSNSLPRARVTMTVCRYT